MAVSTPLKVIVNAKLNNGLNPDGNVKTLSVSLGSLNVNSYDDDKALAVIASLSPCLSKVLYRVEKAYTTSIDDDE